MSLAPAAMLVAAVAVLLAALRGRRTDDHPLCRRCGYDLTGRPDGAADDARCPECGADLAPPRAVRVGHRVRRRGIVAVGVLLLLLGGVGTGVTAWPRVRAFDPLPHEPLWWLRHGMAGPAADRDVVFAEVARRAPWLTAGQLAPFVDRALSIQARPALSDVPAYHLVESARAAGKLPDDRWATYARQAYTLALTARPTVVAGDPLRTDFPVTAVRLDDRWFMVTIDCTSLSVDGRPVPLPSTARKRPYDRLSKIAVPGRIGATATGFDGPILPAVLTDRLSLGTHTVGATVRLSLSEPNPDWGDTPAVDGYPPYHPLGTTEFPVSAPFTVTTAANDVITDESFRPAVQAGVSVSPVQVWGPDGTARLHIEWSPSPVRLLYSVSLRLSGGTELLTQSTPSVGPGAGFTYDGWAKTAALMTADRVDFIFRPDTALARRQQDPTPIWGGTVVVHDVPVYRNGQTPSTRPVRVDGKG